LDHATVVRAEEERNALVRITVERWDKPYMQGWVSKDALLDENHAIGHFSGLIDRNKDDARAYYGRGTALCCVPAVINRSEVLKRAQADLEEAARLNPDFWEAHYVLARLLLDENLRFREAIGEFTELIRLDPKDGLAYLLRGQCYSGLGKDTEAEGDFSTAIRLMPKLAEAYLCRAETRLRLGKYDEVLQDVGQVRALGVQYTVDELTGKALAAKGDLKGAVEAFDAAVAREGEENPALFFDRADALAKLKNYRLALADYVVGEKECRPWGGCHLGPAKLAWFLATCPDRTIRDGHTAVNLALSACRTYAFHDAQRDEIDKSAIEGTMEGDFRLVWIRKEWRKWDYLDILSAAYAETRDYRQASEWCRKAIATAPEKERGALRERLKLYEAGKPYHVPE